MKYMCVLHTNFSNAIFVTNDEQQRGGRANFIMIRLLTLRAS